MVSTLGAITGIAIGSQDHFMVILSGTVIIAVESISMSIGSYISNRSEYEVNQRRIEEEKEEIAEFPEEERAELVELFIRDGWPDELAKEMAEVASKKPGLMLTEMVHRELLIAQPSAFHAFKNSILMFVSYVIGGFLPLVAYLLLPIKSAMPISVVVTLAGLFGIGVITSKYSKVAWYKAGGRVLLLGIAALVVGFLLGEFVSSMK